MKLLGLVLLTFAFVYSAEAKLAAGGNTERDLIGGRYDYDYNDAREYDDYDARANGYEYDYDAREYDDGDVSTPRCSCVTYTMYVVHFAHDQNPPVVSCDRVGGWKSQKACEGS